jgi:aromatic ring-opening dioxygenase catalytic subunit (LigB family)
MKLHYTTWKLLVDAELNRLCGMTSYDLPDYCYADAYEAGKQPKTVARLALKAAKEF